MNIDVAKVVYPIYTVSDACIEGNLNVFNTLIAKDYDFFGDVECKIFGKACEGGNMDIINEMIDRKMHDWNWGLRGACRGGHLEIVKLMIDNGANDWERGFTNACEGGNMDIINLMTSKCTTDQWKGLFDAGKGRKIDIVKFLFLEEDKWNNVKNQFGSADSEFILSWGFLGACEGGNVDIVNFYIEKGVNGENNWSSWYHGFSMACEKGHMNVVKLLMSKIHHSTLNDCIERAYKTGHLEIVEILINVRNTEQGIDSILAHPDEINYPGEYLNPSYPFPYKNKKTKFFHNDIYFEKTKEVFMHMTVLYWTLLYNTYCGKGALQKDLISELIKIMYF